MELQILSENLRKRLTEYRFSHLNKDVSYHINAVEIALCLVEYSLQNVREIKPEEENWFKASYYVQLILENSEWEDISDLYMKMTEEVKGKKLSQEVTLTYYRKSPGCSEPNQ